MARIRGAAFVALALLGVLGSSAAAGGAGPVKLVDAGRLRESIEGQVHRFPPGDAATLAWGPARSAPAVSAEPRNLPESGSRPPSEPPPRVGGTGPAPPPAWVETERGPRWLAFSSFCWSARREARCADFLPESMRSDIPRIRVRPGERVRFHLGFQAREILLSAGARRVLRVRRAATDTLTWRVSRTGLVGLLAYAIRGGSASYVARFR